MNNEKQFDRDINELLKGRRYSDEEIQNTINEIKSTYPDAKIQRVCSYGRVSTKQDEQESSLFTQNIMFHNFCERHKKDGYVLVEEIYDRHSATVALKRKKFMQMIGRARDGEFDILIFKDSKRFSRNCKDFLDIIEDLKREGIYIIFITENVNSETAKRETLTVLGLLAESHSNGLHNSVSSAIAVNMNKPEGRIPATTFGYDKPTVRDCRVAYINEEESLLIKELFNRLNSGEGFTSIIKDWRKRGIKSKLGNEISLQSLKRMARNNIYTGRIEMHKTYKDDVRSDTKKTDPSEWIVTQREDLRIIDDELFYNVQNILDRRSRRDVECVVVRSRPLTGIIKCNCCGKSFVRKRVKDRYYFSCESVMHKYDKKDKKQCNNTVMIRKDVLFYCLGLYFKELIKNQSDIEKLIKSRLAIILKENKKKYMNKSSLDDVKKAEEKFKRAKELFIDGLIEKSELNEFKDKLEIVKASHRMEDMKTLDIEGAYNKFIRNIENLVDNGLDENNMDGVAFNNLFDSIIVYEDGHVDINFQLFSCHKVYIEGTTCTQNVHGISSCLDVDISKFIDWNTVHEAGLIIDKNKLEDARVNQRFKHLGLDLFDKINIII